MKIFKQMLASSLGFTMIELLVVIAVIGVLAVAVLSSINPIEQINKGRDTRTRSDAAQLVNAIDRYYASLEIYPWNYAGLSGGTINDDPAVIFPYTGGPCEALVASGEAGGEGMCLIDEDSSWLDELSRTAEVKEAYVNRVKQQTTYALYVQKARGAEQTMFACFKPSSKAFQVEAIRGCNERRAEIPDGACDPAKDYSALPEYVDELICLP